MLVAEIHPLTLLLGGSAFLLVMSLWIGAVLLWSLRQNRRSGQIAGRLGLRDADREAGDKELRLWLDGREATTHVPIERGLPWSQRAALAYHEAGLGMPLATTVPALLGLCVLAGAFSYLLLPNLALTGAVVGALLAGAWTYLQYRINKRRALFENQLVDALELAARSLRAGHPLMGSFQLISEETAAPVGPLFAQVCERQALGQSVEMALRRAALENPSPDFKLFAVSVAVQIRSGGNLADMMERVAYVIRDRIRLSRRVRVLTAQTQFSKRVLIAVPLFLFLLLNILNRRYMDTLYSTEAGQLLLVISGASLLVGAWLMNRMARVRY